MGTPHNAAERGEIASTVLMPGDPLRAKYIADTYLEDARCFNTVRNMLGYTGTYKGREISVMGGGMGMPSVGIYTYELYHRYEVEAIIRIGSAGALRDDIQLKDVVIGMGACTDSNYAAQYQLPGTFAPIADYRLLEKAVNTARVQGVNVKVGNMGVMAVEMEAAALYMNAARAGKKALCMLTISNHLFRQESISASERQSGFGQMMEIALEL